MLDELVRRTVAFTAPTVDALAKDPPAHGKQVDHFDSSWRMVGYFALRVSYGGAATWIYLYRHRGRLRRMRLGSYPTTGLASAREHAKAAARRADVGEDPAGARLIQRSAGTFAELCRLYIDGHARPNKKSWREDRDKLERLMVPKFASRPAHDVERDEFRRHLKAIAERNGPTMANRTMEVVRHMYRWALDEARAEFPLIAMNPLSQMKPPGGREKAKERFLSAPELRVLWPESEMLGPRWSCFFRLQLLTGARPGEIAGIHKRHLDLEQNWWGLPDSKNAKGHAVPLAPLARDVVDRAIALAPRSQWLFPATTGRADRPAYKGAYKRPQVALRTACGFAEPWTAHDLRRTAYSHMKGEPLSIRPDIVAKCFNHHDQGVGAAYDRWHYDAEKRAALEAWARRLEEIVTGDRMPDNVVKLN